MPLLPCLECGERARWYVWYKGFYGPDWSPFRPYNHFCDEHLIEEIKNGREGWQVEEARLVGDQFLADDDRAKLIEGANDGD